MTHPARFLLAAATLAAASTAFAADGTWTLLNAGNASGTWSADTNWSGTPGTIADGTDGIADFSTLDITATSTIALDSARSIGTLKFGDATTANNDWNLRSAGAGAVTLTLSTSAGTPTINVVNRTATIGTYTAATNVILAGTQGFTKTGTGTLVLASNNTNTYGGTTFISAGTLQIGASGAFGQVGSASTIIDISSGATFKHVAGSAVSQVIQGAGNVIAGGAGLSGNTTTLSGLNTYTGSTTIDGTLLSANTLANSLANSAIGASDGTVATNLVITGGGTLLYSGSAAASTDRRFQIGATTAGGAGTISNNSATANTLTFSNTAAVTYGTNNQTRTVGLGGSNTGANTFAALIGNNGTGVVSLTKSGAGNWSLTNTNTFTGATSIQNGTLTVTSIGESGANGNLGAGNTINLGTTTTTGTLRYTGTGESTNRAIALAGQGGGAIFDQSGASGNLAFTGTATNTGLGSKTVTFQGSTAGTGSFSGNITNAASGSTGLGATFASGATTVTLASVTGVTVGSTISGTGIAGGTTVLSIAGNVVTLSTATTAASGSVGATYTVSGVTNITSVTKNGTGTWTLSGANTYSGQTTINAGTLAVGNDSALGTGTIRFGGGTLVSSDATDRTFTGNVLDVAASSTLGSATSGKLTFTGTNASVFGGSAKTLTVNGVVEFTGVLTSGVSAVNAITKAGTGTLIFSGANTYNRGTASVAGTVISAGTLLANNTSGSATGLGVVSVSSGATLGGKGFITGGTITVNSGATLQGGDGTTGTTLTIGSGVSLSDGSIIKLALGGAGAASTLARTGGTWSFDADQTFNLVDLGGAAGTYTLITGLVGDETGLSTIETWQNTSGLAGTFQLAGNSITFTAVPEPSTYGLIGAGVLAVAAAVRRRRKNMIQA